MVHIRKIIFIRHRVTPTTYTALSYYIKCFPRLCSRSKCQSSYSTLETKLSLDTGADAGRVCTKGVKRCSRIQNSLCPGHSAWGPLTAPWARPPRPAFLTNPTPWQPPPVPSAPRVPVTGVISPEELGDLASISEWWELWPFSLFAATAALSVTVPTWHTAGVQKSASWNKTA